MNGSKNVFSSYPKRLFQLYRRSKDDWHRTKPFYSVFSSLFVLLKDCEAA